MLDRQANVKIGQKEQADSMFEMRDRTSNSLYYYYLFFFVLEMKDIGSR